MTECGLNDICVYVTVYSIIKYIMCYKQIYRKCGHEVWIEEQAVYTNNN